MTQTISACNKIYGDIKKRHVPAFMLNETAELQFKPVTTEAMPLIWRYLSCEPGRTCDFSYGGLLIWAPLFDYQYDIYKDTLFIKGRLEGDLSKYAYSLPVGNLPLEQCISLLRAHCLRGGETLRFSAIPEYAVDDFRGCGAAGIRPLPDWADYLYDIEPLATLTGKKMAKKRNHVNKFESLYPDHRFMPLTADNIEDARALLDIANAESDDYSEMAASERRLCAIALDQMAEGVTVMKGGILYADDRPAAFTVGDIKGDTLFIHIEKGNREVPGAYEAINKYFAAYMLAGHPELKYINREDDAGDPGLRRSKSSYHPKTLLLKYDVTF